MKFSDLWMKLNLRELGKLQTLEFCSESIIDGFLCFCMLFLAFVMNC